MVVFQFDCMSEVTRNRVVLYPLVSLAQRGGIGDGEPSAPFLTLLLS